MDSRAPGRDDRGFTLTELMVVLLILAILILIAIASFAYTTQTAAKITCEANRDVFDTAIVIFRSEHDTAPDDIGDLAPYVSNFDTAKTCPADRTTLLRYDPTLDRVVCDYHE